MISKSQYFHNNFKCAQVKILTWLQLELILLLYIVYMQLVASKKARMLCLRQIALNVGESAFAVYNSCYITYWLAFVNWFSDYIYKNASLDRVVFIFIFYKHFSFAQRTKTDLYVYKYIRYLYLYIYILLVPKQSIRKA